VYTVLIIIHIVTCILLIGAVLLQKGKGAEVGAVFGASEAIFGSAGPVSFLNKFTTGLAILFMITSLSLTYLLSHRGSGSVMEDVKVESAPMETVTPAPPAGAPEETQGTVPEKSSAPSGPDKQVPPAPQAGPSK